MKSKRLCCAVLLGVLLCMGATAAAQRAVVDNGQDSASQLNLRSAPSRDSAALGKFYSGTVVEIVADAGDGWAKVSIGGGACCLNGYMMTSYLSDDGSLLNATFEVTVVSPYGTPSVVLRDHPSDSFGAVAMLAVGETVRVIGTSGNYYIVQLADSTVGCLSVDEVR